MFNFYMSTSPKVNGHKMVAVHCQNIPKCTFIYEIIGRIVDSEYEVNSETDVGYCCVVKYVNNIQIDVASTEFFGGNRTNIGKDTGYLPRDFSFRIPKFLLKKVFQEENVVYTV